MAADHDALRNAGKLQGMRQNVPEAPHDLSNGDKYLYDEAVRQIAVEFGGHLDEVVVPESSQSRKWTAKSPTDGTMYQEGTFVRRETDLSMTDGLRTYHELSALKDVKQRVGF